MTRKKIPEVQQAPPNLKELVFSKESIMERIKHLESEMSFKDKRTSMDEDLLKELLEKNRQAAKSIYDLCYEHSEDCHRFLSEEEIAKITADQKNLKH